MKIKRFAVIGYPLGHSLSPLLHPFLLNEINEAGVYERIEVAENLLQRTLETLRQKYAGFNITIPYKQKIISFLDEIDESARLIGAVNTVFIRNGQLFGYNTDGIGFIQSLKNKNIEIKDKTALVLGAGGAARAVLFGLINEGIKEILLLNRTVEKARQLSHEIKKSNGFERLGIFDWNGKSFKSSLASSDIVVNTTPIGMWPDVNKTPFALDVPLNNKAVIDLIYNPLQTIFLKQGEENSATAVDGLDMFIFQAIAALKIWLERNIEFDYIKVRAFLTNKLESYG